MDILKPFSGAFGHLYLRDEEAIFLVPSVKKYYKEDFKSGRLLPWSKNISVAELVSILKGEPLGNGACKIQRKRFFCKTEEFEVFLKKQGFKKTSIVLKVGNQKEIKIKVRRLTSGILKEELFSYSLKDYHLVEKWEELVF